MVHKIIDFNDGSSRWSLTGSIFNYHRDILPASFSSDGCVRWFQHSKEYRPSVDLPSSYRIEGVLWYEVNGITRRSSGPSYIVIDASTQMTIICYNYLYLDFQLWIKYAFE